MTEVVSMSFKIVEPMMFRGPGEFDPFVRGTYSRAATLPMPSPSTVAGTLATYCISKLNIPIPSSGDWLEQYLSVLGGDIEIRGPLIKLGDELMTEDRIAKGFLKMSEVRQKCEKEWKKLAQRLESLEQFDEVQKDDFRPSIELKKNLMLRVGVRLQMRETISTKCTMEGFLYGAEYIDYTGVKNRESSVEITVEVRGNLVKRLRTAQATPVKFGGEGRVALLSFQQGEKILSEIKRLLWHGQEDHKGHLALYLATPALFKRGRVEEQLNHWLESVKCKFIGLSGESTALGAGFMMRENRRKPIYISLIPGSIIFLEGDFNLPEMYRKPLSEASMLGYGTFIPVPIS